MTEKKGRATAIYAKLWPFGPDLLPRLLSAIVLIPLTAIALVAGWIPFALLIALVMAGAYREWEAMITGRQSAWPAVFFMGLIAIAAIGHPMNGAWTSAIVFGIAIVLALFIKAPNRHWRISGIVFFGFATVAFLAIRGSSAVGIWAGVFLVSIVWMTDIGAYFIGRIVGGTKLSPDVSPSKTWSGAAGGLCAGTLSGIAVWFLAGWMLDTPSPFAIGLLISVVVSISGQLGDLAESAVKRRFAVKDSGDIIPGHGGLMDRIDSLTSAGIVLWCIGLANRGLGAVPQGILFW
ncbi:phosphatidate cytidylyltransferase [Pelagibacterium flavum]|uniref:Phosphatidate cytidylyltransferase n=1 Tax=Pelagibacterium flavum TaxID=2984530 RepID=A0ABY6IJF8_9HYPH|nr:phosphatidate cytidylyltransferase [Pelagibacterium sp. YIM 151497]UYQ70616.1 phosphatidate cytidylyltransferase [Pelagibacterium sp. YIM 151497]